MASTYLTRTNGSAPINTTKATVSCWVKKSGLDNHQGIFGIRNTGNNNINVQCGFFNGKWYMWYKDGSTDYYLQDSAVTPRDVNAWYHVVFRFDTTQGTAGDRLRVYVNGEDLGNSSFSTKSNPTSNDDIIIGTNGLEWSIGRYTFTGGSQNYFDGSISHFHYCDGYSYAPTEFGETDSTTGEWKIKTSPSVSYGNNGFFVLKDGNSVTDASPNTNNFTVAGGTLTKTEDCPSNVFATLNPLFSCAGQNAGVSTFTNGNNTAQGANNSYVNGCSSLMMSSGKWYAEMKYVATSADVTRILVGITNDAADASRINQDNGSYNTSYNNYDGAGNKNVQGSASTYGNNWGVGDIIGIAFDADNEKLYFSVNGTWQNSGVPTSGSTGTGAITGFTAISSTNHGGYFFFSGSNSNAQNNTVSWNFGNGYFGTSAVSSAGTNASNIGIFEYDVPSGYTALSTKGLNE